MTEMMGRQDVKENKNKVVDVIENFYDKHISKVTGQKRVAVWVGREKEKPTHFCTILFESAKCEKISSIYTSKEDLKQHLETKCTLSIEYKEKNGLPLNKQEVYEK